MPETALPRGYLLGFDFGLKRIGVAVGQGETCTASSLETVANGREPDWAAIGRLMSEWRPRLVVIGVPLGPEGEETPMSRAARRFGEQFASRYAVEVAYTDERLSSHEARDRFIRLRSEGGLRRKDAQRLDAVAAQVILENWLQSHAGGVRAN